MKNVLPSLVNMLQAPVPPIATDVDGFTSPKMRWLLNLLVAWLPQDEVYFEVGCLKGATLISALLDHPEALAYACDNWSEFAEYDARKYFFENIKRYKSRLPEITVHEENCFSLAERIEFRGPIGIYLYDGCHRLEDQRRAITAYARHFSNEVIVLVDDWNLEEARRGTFEALAELNPRELWFTGLPAKFNGDTDGFWNGVGAFHMRLR